MRKPYKPEGSVLSCGEICTAHIPKTLFSEGTNNMNCSFQNSSRLSLCVSVFKLTSEGIMEPTTPKCRNKQDTPIWELKVQVFSLTLILLSAFQLLMVNYGPKSYQTDIPINKDFKSSKPYITPNSKGTPTLPGSIHTKQESSFCPVISHHKCYPPVSHSVNVIRLCTLLMFR